MEAIHRAYFHVHVLYVHGIFTRATTHLIRAFAWGTGGGTPTFRTLAQIFYRFAVEDFGHILVIQLLALIFFSLEYLNTSMLVRGLAMQPFQLWASFLCLSICASATTQPIVDLGYARYQGKALPNGISQWLGIRYAAPPLKNLRFEAPQDPPSVDGVQDASTVIYSSPLSLPNFCLNIKVSRYVYLIFL